GDDQRRVRRRVARIGEVEPLVRAVVAARGDGSGGDALAGRGRRALGCAVARLEARRLQVAGELGERRLEVRVEGRLPDEEPVGGEGDRLFAPGERALRAVRL